MTIRDPEKLISKVRKILDEARRYERERRCKLSKGDTSESNCKLSEGDTSAILVEPILCLAGYNIYSPFSVKRASSSPTARAFDIEAYKDDHLFLAIEVKALSSDEFNIGKLEEGIGKLRKGKEKGHWCNCSGDGVGQLRAYCLNWKNKLADAIPILTNGERWVLFDLQKFRQRPEDPIKGDAIVANCSIEDNEFGEEVISKMTVGV